MPLRERDMGEGDCCSGRACQNMPPPLDQDLPEHTQKKGEKDRVSPSPCLPFCVISVGQRNYGWRGGGSCDIAAAATLNVSLDEKGLCVCVALLDKLQTFFFL